MLLPTVRAHELLHALNIVRSLHLGITVPAWVHRKVKGLVPLINVTQAGVRCGRCKTYGQKLGEVPRMWNEGTPEEKNHARLLRDARSSSLYGKVPL
jgi:hypothetical protein